MLRQTEFFLQLDPPTTSCQNKRRGANHTVYDAPALKEAKTLYNKALTPHILNQPLEGPLKITLVFLFPFLKSAPKKIKELQNLYKISKPDVDNSAKLLIDRMASYKIKETGQTVNNFFANDNQIAELSVKKKYATIPGVYVKIEELPPSDPNPRESEFIQNYLSGETNE